jgi:hypothetical protein
MRWTNPLPGALVPPGFVPYSIEGALESRALAVFSLIGLRLVELQFADSATLAARGLVDRLSTVDLPAPRGAIYDRNGAVLAHSVEARYVYVDPYLADDPAAGVDPAKIAARLSPLLGIATSKLLPPIRRHNRPDASRPGSSTWPGASTLGWRRRSTR